MMELNRIQEALVPHISKAEYQAICDETEELMVENQGLKARIDYLERHITTHAYCGWQTH